MVNVVLDRWINCWAKALFTIEILFLKFLFKFSYNFQDFLQTKTNSFFTILKKNFFGLLQFFYFLFLMNRFSDSLINFLFLI